MGWRFWVDRGGTFTDVVGLSPSGEIVVRKVLSVQPERRGDPAVRAIASLLQQPQDVPIPPQAISELRLGTTVATNALLERRGAAVLLLINAGLGDQLSLGDLHRPELFALKVERPSVLHQRVIEVSGRLAADGSELEPLQLDATLAQRVRDAVADGYRSVAIALLHSYRNPAHEEQLHQWLFGLGLDLQTISLSHRISRLPRLVPRGQTTLVEAAVAPVLRRYLDQVDAALGGAASLRVMRSSGALAPRSWLLAKDTILSGPAGGVVGALAVARQALALAGLPLQPVVGFDMGGTSTDVFHAALVDGVLRCERSPETAIAGLQLQAPMLPIHTVAAGGGSIVQFDGQRLQVGPQSAGADPGPAAYGRGGPLTVTDANVLLGRLPIVALPPVFGPAGDAPLRHGPVRQGFARLAAAMQAQQPGISAEQIAAGALQVAIETMAAAIRRISIEQGHDPRQALLVSYGGAAAQHACRLAAELGMTRVLVHPLAGVLSAYGIGQAPQALLLERPLRQPLNPELLEQIQQHRQELVAEGLAQLAAVIDLDQAPVEIALQLELRHPSQERGFALPWAADVALLHQAYGVRHRQLYGYPCSDEQLVVERLLVELRCEPGAALGAIPQVAPSAGIDAAELATAPLWLDALQGWQSVPLWPRQRLAAGDRLDGPALVTDAITTLVLEPGWQLQRLADGALLLERQAQTIAVPGMDRAELLLGTREAGHAGVDPILLELYHHRFAAIAVQMGVQLQQSARSLNIRERLDFSCALFDRHGALVANAPHIPVHLGSMGASVASLLAAIDRGERRALQPGDVVLSNNPYNGGTHLPDITAITPVFVAGSGAEPAFFVASRGHHADVGGLTPGSMPAHSRTIDDEGLLLDNVWLLEHGRLDEPLWRGRFAALRHPVRNPDLLLADLQAQVAANCSGAAALQALLERQGLPEVQAYMTHVQANAAATVRRLISRLQPGQCSLDLDDGGRICVSVAIDAQQQRLHIDFSGTSAQHEGNRNAPLAVTHAVVLYVIRTLVAEAIPLNAGCFEPLELIVPPGTLLNPLPPAAVVAGNVELSQATANALFLALGVQAASQGTMNNLSFGDGRHQYYETIGGGCGAGLGYAGGSAFQSHMTNSRLTDPEVLEERLPVRLEQMSQRRGSGGPGHWQGGDGVVRQLRFLAPMQVSLISGSRLVPPPGLGGGQSGLPGRNLLLRANGLEQELPGSCQISLSAGEALRLETPGGGGFGPVSDAPPDQADQAERQSQSHPKREP